MRLARARGDGRSRLSLVPMIDVLMIMLVFFMVTSTYLDLDMVPLAGAEAPTTGSGADGWETSRLMVRIDAAGQAHFRGQPRDPRALTSAFREELSHGGNVEVLVLPSAQADVQALASAMDALVAAGVSHLRVVRIEALP